MMVNFRYGQISPDSSDLIYIIIVIDSGMDFQLIVIVIVIA